MIVGEPVGVVGERGLLRQHRHPGEQPGGGVGEQVVDVRHPPGAGELERQQRQQPVERGDHGSAGIARSTDQARKVEGDQVGEHEQQPGSDGVKAFWPGGKADQLRPGQLRVTPWGRRTDAPCRFGPTQQPAEAFFGQDLCDRGAIERSPLEAKAGGDLIGRQSFPAQLDHPGPHRVLARPGSRPPAGPARWGEQVELPGPVLAGQIDHRPAGVAEPSARLGIGQPVHVVRPQRLVAPLVQLRWGGEELRGWLLW
jgi:hypothetical protein